MQRASTKGLLLAFVSAASFGSSGAVIKPLLEAGWSPAAAVTVRALVAGVVLLPIALVVMRGRWDALWRARWRVLLMALIGVAGTQVLYFAAIQRIPVSTAVLIEYLAPVLLVIVAWVTSRRLPKAVVLIGSARRGGWPRARAGVARRRRTDPIGLGLALLAMVGAAIDYLVAARPSDGLPPVALAAFSLVLGGVVLGLIGLTGLLPLSVTFGTVDLFGGIPWWIPLLWVIVISTAVAYATSITASEILGSRLSSFVGLLEVVAATLYAWGQLGETPGWMQLIGGVLILVGIGFVRSEKPDVDAPIEAVPLTEPEPAPRTLAPRGSVRASRCRAGRRVPARRPASRNRMLERGPSANERLEGGAGGVDDECNGIRIGFVADQVRRAAGQRHGIAGGRRDPLCRIADVEGELALAHEVDLARLVPVQHRRTATGPHPDLHREQRTVGLGAGRQHGDFVAAEREVLGPGSIDR